MKKLLKILLCMIFVLVITGCSQSKSNEKNTEENKKEDTVSKTTDSQYFENFNQEYGLKDVDYAISVPSQVSFKRYDSTDYFSTELKNGNQIDVIITMMVAMDSEYDDILDASVTEQYSYARKNAFLMFHPDYTSFSFSKDSMEKDVDDHETKYDYGIMEGSSSSENNKDLCRYAAYRFVLRSDEYEDLNDTEYSICEVMVLAEDMDSDLTEDDLAKIAEELISQIHKIKE